MPLTVNPPLTNPLKSADTPDEKVDSALVRSVSNLLFPVLSPLTESYRAGGSFPPVLVLTQTKSGMKSAWSVVMVRVWLTFCVDPVHIIGAQYLLGRGSREVSLIVDDVIG